jgi:hypothetical protein
MKTYQNFLTEAQKRISQYTVYTGRAVDSAKKARESGSFREPRASGASGYGIYGSTNKNVAREYSRRAGATPEHGDMGVVQLRVPKKDMTTVEPGFKGRSQSYDKIKERPETKAVRISDTATPDELRRPKKVLTGLGKRDSSGDHIVMNPKYAAGKIVKNPPPIIKKK